LIEWMMVAKIIPSVCEMSRRPTMSGVGVAEIGRIPGLYYINP